MKVIPKLNDEERQYFVVMQRGMLAVYKFRNEYVFKNLDKLINLGIIEESHLHGEKAVYRYFKIKNTHPTNIIYIEE
jgi:hypothetical protein